MAELQPFARQLGVSDSGAKQGVIDRVAAALGRRSIPPPERAAPVASAIEEPFRTGDVDSDRSAIDARPDVADA